MVTRQTQIYSRCFISAPFGMDLGVLPVLLGERRIAWNWSSDEPLGGRYSEGIMRCDFMIAVLNGSQYDHRVLYEAGLAEGMNKPVLFIATSKRVGNFARTMFSTVEVKLSEREPLAFHLDAFLATPHESIFDRDRSKVGSPSKIAPASSDIGAPRLSSLLERRVFEAVIAAGGSAIAQPRDEETKLRPDLLIWLASQDAELLDPAVVEIKEWTDGPTLKKAQQQLVDFLRISGVRCGFLLTEQEPPENRIALSPYLFWLSIDHFVTLTTDHRLGSYLRKLRNRAAHGGS